MTALKTLARFFRVLWAGIDSVRKVLHLILLLFVFALIGGVLSPPPATLPASAALVLAPAGALVEELEGDPFDRALAEVLEETVPQTRLRDLIDALEYARTDDRIEAVLLELGALGGGGLSKLERLGEAIDDFRESGKPVIASADFYSQAGYYVAARADEAYMHPDGLFLPQGFALYSNYFQEAIEKLKIDWNVFRVGTHKSAVEPFTRMDMSDEDRASRTALVEQLWSRYQERVVTARGLEADALHRYADNLLANQERFDGDMAMAAAELGLLDGLMTRDQLQQKLVELVGEDEDNDRGYPATGMSEYLRQMRMLEGPTKQEKNVAVVIASGEVLNGDQAPGMIGGESTARLLRRARMDDSVHAVVLRIDSPGGSSFAAEQIRNEVEALRAAGKPVVASMSSIAASAGYWIAMAADEIYARESTITGSIGVFLMLPTFQRTLGELGVASDGVGSTRWSGQFRVDRELSDDARRFLQNFVNKGYDDFISMVAVYRDMEKARVDEVAQGQVWTGKDALGFGLIDAIGDLDEAAARAAELASIGAEDYGITYIEQKLSPTERMIVDMLGGLVRRGYTWDLAGRAISPVSRQLLDIVDGALSPLLRFDDPRGMYSHCFCTVE
jgi:protease-4